MFLGLDVGTSYCKAAVVTENGALIRSVSTPTPPGLFTPGFNVSSFVTGPIRKLIRGATRGSHSLQALAVSAVAPALVAFFDQAERSQVVFSHLTTTNVGAGWPGKDFSSRLYIRRRRTEQRLHSTGISSVPYKFLLPLNSAIAFLLTGKLRLDPVYAYELGFETIDTMSEFCRLDKTISSGFQQQYIGASLLRTPLAVSVTTDTCASMIGAGLRYPAEGMIYYGTYFSAVELKVGPRRLFFSDALKEVPYVWHVSLPRYGMFLESLLRLMTGDRSLAKALERFEVALAQRTLFNRDSLNVRVVPLTQDVVTSDATPTLRIELCGPSFDFVDVSLALALPLGEALRRSADAGALASVRTWYAAGGGAQNRELLRLTSAVTGIQQTVRAGSWTAKGAALLGAWAMDTTREIVDSTDLELISPP